MPPFKGSVMQPVEGRDLAQYGEIGAFPVGSRWADRRELCDSGVHCNLSGGIHGRGETGAFSVVLSGGYADDVDDGEEFTYTGQGGQAHREVGAKWDNVQVRDQEWKLGNLALKTSCALRKPVRVVRGSGLKSPYAPVTGYRYDGLYFVEEAFMKPGIRGFQVCLFRFRRCPGQEPLPSSSRETRPIKRQRIEIHPYKRHPASVSPPIQSEEGRKNQIHKPASSASSSTVVNLNPEPPKVPKPVRFFLTSHRTSKRK